MKTFFQQFARLVVVTCLVMVPVSLTSCMTASGTGSSWTITAVATDIDDLDITPAGMKGTIKQSESFRAVLTEVRKMWQGYLIAEGLKYVAGKYYDNQAAEVSSTQTVKLEELRNAKSAADAKAALEAAKQAAAAEEAAAAAAAATVPAPALPAP